MHADAKGEPLIETSSPTKPEGWEWENAFSVWKCETERMTYRTHGWNSSTVDWCYSVSTEKSLGESEIEEEKKNQRKEKVSPITENSVQIVCNSKHIIVNTEICHSKHLLCLVLRMQPVLHRYFKTKQRLPQHFLPNLDLQHGFIFPG